MRALVLDCGNTRIKAGIYVADRLLEVRYIAPEFFSKQVHSLVEQYTIDTCCLSDVSIQAHDYYEQLRPLIPYTHQVSAASNLPFEKGEHFYPSLGSDRIAAMVGGYLRFRGHGVLVVDAGTAITYDFIDARGLYNGGLITAGIDMRLQALHTFTGRLPLVERPHSRTEPFTNGTTACIQSGVAAGVVGEIEYLLMHLRERELDFSILLTGGNADCLSKLYICKNFVAQNLVLEGLYGLLNCNV